MLPTPLRRPLIAFGGIPLGSQISRQLLPRVDRLTRRLTGGRRTFTQLVLPTLVLTTTGRRTGLRREQPLAFLREGDAYAVAGSNWGQDHHPGWSHNLLVHPDATVAVGGSTIPVRGELVTGADRDRLYRRFEDLAPTYRRYGRTTRGRDIRVFLLHPRRPD